MTAELVVLLGDREVGRSSRASAWAPRRGRTHRVMQRSYALDVKKCAKCGGRLRVLATIVDPVVVRQILDHLRVRSTPLPRAPARDPTWDQQAFQYDDEAA